MQSYSLIQGLAIEKRQHMLNDVGYADLSKSSENALIRPFLTKPQSRLNVLFLMFYINSD